MPRPGAERTLTIHFTTSDFPGMAKELEAAAQAYQQLYGKRPNYVFVHSSIGTNLEPHLTYNFYSKDHQITTQWHQDHDTTRVILADRLDP